MKKYIAYHRASSKSPVNTTEVFQEKLMALFAENYRQEMSRRVKAGILRKKERAFKNPNRV